MASVFKNIAKGALYVIGFPFGLIAIAGYAVFGVFVFFFQFIRLIILFFTGRSLRSDLPEDIQAKKIIEANKPKEEEESPLSLYPSDSIVYSGGYQSPTFNDEPKQEEQTEEKEVNENDEHFDHLV